MGFFSFNSEILSLSDTIKTNRGRRGVLSNRNPGWFEPGPGAPRAGPGPGPAGEGAGDSARTSGAPPGHPWAPGRFANWRVSGQGKRPCPDAVPPLLPSFRASKGRVPGPPFLGRRRRLRPKRPSRPAPLQCSPSRVPPPPGPQRHPCAFGGAWEKQRPVGTGGRTPGGRHRTPVRVAARRGPGLRGGPAAAVPRPGRCLTCGEAAEQEGERRPESQGWSSCPSPHTHPSSSACYH